MVRIRLRRVGAKKQPSYRLVVADQRKPRDGRFIEEIGHYNPRTEPATVMVKKERALYWLRNGAQPSEAVERLLRKTGVWDVFKGIAPETEEAEEEAVAEAAAEELTTEAEDVEPAAEAVEEADAVQAEEVGEPAVEADAEADAEADEDKGAEDEATEEADAEEEADESEEDA